MSDSATAPSVNLEQALALAARVQEKVLAGQEVSEDELRACIEMIRVSRTAAPKGRPKGSTKASKTTAKLEDLDQLLGL